MAVGSICCFFQINYRKDHCCIHKGRYMLSSQSIGKKRIWAYFVNLAETIWSNWALGTRSRTLAASLIARIQGNVHILTAHLLFLSLQCRKVSRCVAAPRIKTELCAKAAYRLDTVIYSNAWSKMIDKNRMSRPNCGQNL